MWFLSCLIAPIDFDKIESKLIQIAQEIGSERDSYICVTVALHLVLNSLQIELKWPR